jgi:hypothetical protein
MSDVQVTPFDPDHEDDSGRAYPWAPQSGETALAFSYFTSYRDSGPRRTVAATARALGREAGTLRMLSVKHSWPDRAKAYDAWLDRQATESLAQGRTQMRQAYVDMAETARKKIMQRLEKLDPDEMSVRDLAQWIELTNKIERQNREMPDKVIRHEGEVNIVDQLDTAARRSLMAEAQRILAERLGISRPDALESSIVDAEVVEVDDAGEAEGQ